jgi:hypothetical protein
MMEGELKRLTASDSVYVNAFFEDSLIYLLVSGALNVGQAWWKMSGVTPPVVRAGAGLALWCVVLGFYRLLRR